MLGIKVNGYFLQLKPGITSELERKSPFFSMEEYAGDSTTEALIFPYTPDNAIALDLPYQFYTERKKRKYDADLYSDNMMQGKCTLVIETGKLNINNIEATEISGYLLYGLSHFFQQIKDKRLQDLKLGGIRTFGYTSDDPDDASDGYWQHFHETWTNDDIPYVFYPVRNEGYFSSGSVEWMNKLDRTGYRTPNISKLEWNADNVLVPMIRLKYLVEQIFAEAGYDIDLSELTGTDWEKLTLVSLVKVDWTTIGPYEVSPGVITNIPMHASLVNIDLSKHVPQGKLISDFLIQLFFRFGWALLFDPASRKCRFSLCKTLGQGTKKDWTEYANPGIPTAFNEDPKIIAFKNEIESNDQFPTAPDFENFLFQGNWISRRTQAPPTAADVGRLVYNYNENQWVEAIYDDGLAAYVWSYVADNIFDEDPTNATDSISTTISTLPVQWSEYRDDSGTLYYGMFPIMNQNSQTKVGYRLLFYLGLQLDAQDGNPPVGNYQYPHASSIRTGIYGNVDGYPAWSNVYKHYNYLSDADYGIIEYWWKNFLPIIQNGEEQEIDFNLPVHILNTFSWDDVIMVRNVPYIVKSLIEPLPYKGIVRTTVKRLTKDPYIIPAVAIDEDGNSVKVWAHLSQTNIAYTLFGGAFGYRKYTCDNYVNLYSDPGGTIPFTPATTFYVLIEVIAYESGSEKLRWEAYYGMNSNVLYLGNRFFKLTDNSGAVENGRFDLQLTVSNTTAYNII